MPLHVRVGQHWSAWVPGRRQWLLAKVVSQADGQATLRFDTGYGMAGSQNEQRADELAMLNTPNLFRFVDEIAAPEA